MTGYRVTAFLDWAVEIPIWYRAKIREPVAFMNTLLFSGVSLNGVNVAQGVHPKFAAMLQRVDTSIANVTKRLKIKSAIVNPAMKGIKYIGCFRPQPLGDKISNHMIGAAIDIDPDPNPHLYLEHIRALDKMLAFIAEDEAKANPLGPPPEKLKIETSWLAELPKLGSFDDVDRARIFYDKTVKISEKTRKFLSDFLGEWKKYRDQKKTPADQRLQKAFEIIDELVKLFPRKKPSLPVEDTLAVVQKQGLISIPAEVFIALDSDPDIQWAQYIDIALKYPKQLSPGLDTMHFEVTDQAGFIGSGLP